MIIIVSSLVVLAQAILIVQVIRYIAKAIFTGTLFTLLDELLAFIQLSCCILELGVITKQYGFQSIHAILSTFVFLTIKHILFFRGEYIGTPVTYVEFFYHAKRRIKFSVGTAFWIILAEIVGSLLAHPLLRLLWGRSFSEFHNKEVFIECQSTLQVSFLTGFTVEVIASFISLGSDLLTPFHVKPPVRALTTIVLSQLFQKTSGVWMNPVIASAHTFRCAGHGSTFEHFLIYWLGPLLGVALVYEVKEILQTLMVQAKTHAPPRVQNLKKQSADVHSKAYKNSILNLFGLFQGAESIDFTTKDFEALERDDSSQKHQGRRRKTIKKNRGW